MERKKTEGENRKTNYWNNSTRCTAVEHSVKKFAQTIRGYETSRSLADIAEQLCSIDPASDSVITCKYLPIFHDDKQLARVAIFDELCS